MRYLFIIFSLIGLSGCSHILTKKSHLELDCQLIGKHSEGQLYECDDL